MSYLNNQEDLLNARLSEQGHSCAICGIRDPDEDFVLDVDPETQVPRGVLCRDCDDALELVEDNPGLLLAAVEYLEGCQCESCKAKYRQQLA